MKKPKPKRKRRTAEPPASWLDYPTEAAPARQRATPAAIPQDRLDQRSCLLAARACMVDMRATAAQVILEIDHALK